MIKKSAFAVLAVALAAGAVRAAAPRAADFDGGAAGVLMPGVTPELRGSAEAADVVSGEVFTMDGMRTVRVPRAALRAAEFFGAVAYGGSAMGWASLLGSGCTMDPDVPGEIQEQLRADLKFIKRLRGTAGSRLHQKIFGAVDGRVYGEFFEKRVKAVGLGNCGDSNAVACVYPFSNPTKMWLTPNYIKFHHPQIARLMIIFHESRHTETENGNWRHAKCPQPFLDGSGKEIRSIWTGASLAGERACDVTPLGSYGSSLIMLKNISKYCVNCTDKMRFDAGLYADDQLKRMVDPAARRDIYVDLYR
ncbi:MAG: hypothetical protein PHF00_06940 [Elusimicrobia bacterium]|nr:hypothetical protein [Elusimicrobiota bacterium]